MGASRALWIHMLLAFRGAVALQRAQRRAASTACKATTLDDASLERIRAAGAAKRTSPLRMPKRLSPTAATTFRECEQLFLFRNLWRLPEPPSPALVKGSLVHLVLERMFERPAEERTPENLEAAFREEWRNVRGSYLGASPPLFGDRDAERDWGLESFQLLRNYVAFEDPADADLDARVVANEEWLEGEVAVEGGLPPLVVVGKLDRLDALDGGLRVVDYKTGRSAGSKAYYPPALRAELEDRALFQLRIYAWMLEKQFEQDASLYSTSDRVAELRLLYLGGDAAEAVDEALPADADARRRVLDGVQDDLRSVWADIHARVAENDPAAFPHCDRKWCFCHIARPMIFDEVAADAPAEPAAPAAPAAPLGDDLASLPVKELRARCKARGLNAVVPRGSPAKETLLERLRAS